MTRHGVLILALLVAACGNKATPEDKARSDAADVAFVQAAQDRHPPPQAITPAPITPEDRARHSLAGAGCSFVPEGAPDALPLLVAFSDKAMVRLEGKPLVLAADSASAEVAQGVREEYVGRTHAVRLARGAQDGAFSLTITDEFERPVFTALGALECGA